MLCKAAEKKQHNCARYLSTGNIFVQYALDDDDDDDDDNV